MSLASMLRQLWPTPLLSCWTWLPLTVVSISFVISILPCAGITRLFRLAFAGPVACVCLTEIIILPHRPYVNSCRTIFCKNSKNNSVGPAAQLGLAQQFIRLGSVSRQAVRNDALGGALVFFGVSSDRQGAELLDFLRKIMPLLAVQDNGKDVAVFHEGGRRLHHGSISIRTLPSRRSRLRGLER